MLAFLNAPCTCDGERCNKFKKRNSNLPGVARTRVYTDVHEEACAKHWLVDQGNVGGPTSKQGKRIVALLVKAGILTTHRRRTVVCCACHLSDENVTVKKKRGNKGSNEGQPGQPAEIQLKSGGRALTAQMRRNATTPNWSTSKTRATNEGGGLASTTQLPSCTISSTAYTPSSRLMSKFGVCFKKQSSGNSRERRWEDLICYVVRVLPYHAMPPYHTIPYCVHMCVCVRVCVGGKGVDYTICIQDAFRIVLHTCMFSVH